MINPKLHLYYLRNFVLKLTLKQKITHKGIPIRLTADLSAETLQARREWQDILKAMKGKNLQPRLVYPARISFRLDGEIKTFTDKQKLSEFSQTSFTANDKGASLGRKHKRRKRPTITNPIQLRKW